jgi:hypothetical protein
MGHLQEIGETYWEHFSFASRIAVVLFLTSFVLLFHAFFPNRQKNTASDVVAHLHAIFEARKNGEELPEESETETGVS